jgi:hypothetical protein
MGKKEDNIYKLMYSKACTDANIPIPAKIDLFDKSYLQKNMKNTCLCCHDFKSTSIIPQQKLSKKERDDKAHKCNGVCPGFIHCHFVKVWVLCCCCGLFE